MPIISFYYRWKRVLSHENRAKKEAIIERWTDSLQILDKIFGLEKVTRKLVATIKFYHTLIWYQHSIL